jgi:F-type H+-transporting ATPase subunit gamma
MASLKDIRSRIASVKNTQQITRAMKMVSAAKLRRAQQNIVNLRPYARKLLEVIADIAVTRRVHHPLLSTIRSPKRVLLVVLTSDRGLCGGFNANINRFAYRYFLDHKAEHDQLDFLLIGRKAADFFKARKVAPKDVMLNLAREVSFSLADKVAGRLMEGFVEGNYEAVYIIYNEFKSAIAQNVVCEQLLPVDLTKTSFVEEEGKPLFAQDLIFEPAPEEMLQGLLERHFAVQVYRCMCESVAAEHGARMSAMENATKNAAEMIRSMTLTYNKLRQASITTELIEITSGAEALKG